MVGILRTDGGKIVDEKGTEVFLKGAGLGGWMKYAPPPLSASPL
jgi:hypothetical protein